MATKRYNSDCKLTGYTGSDAEMSRKNAESAFLLILAAIAVLPILPFIGIGFLERIAFNLIQIEGNPRQASRWLCCVSPLIR